MKLKSILIILFAVIGGIKAQTVQPYIMANPLICDGAGSGSATFQVKIVNSGGNPANYGNVNFRTTWYLQINGTTISSGSFQGQVGILNFSGITYYATDVIYMYAYGTGLNTAPLKYDQVPVSLANSPAQPVITASGTTICVSGSVSLSCSSSGYTTNWYYNSGFYTNSTSFSTSTGGTYSVNETNMCGTSATSSVVITVKTNRLQASGPITLGEINNALGRPFSAANTTLSNLFSVADSQVPKSPPYRISSFYNYCY